MTVDNAGYFLLCYNETKGDKKICGYYTRQVRHFLQVSQRFLQNVGSEDRFRRGNRSFMVMLLQDGLASVVVPIDKLSILVTIIFSRIVFGERLNKKSLIGLGLIVAGTILLSLIS